MRGRKTVTICQGVDLLRGQLFQQRLGQIAQKRVPQTVDRLEMFEQKNQLLEMLWLEFAVHAVQRMRNGVRDLRTLGDSFADRKCFRERFRCRDAAVLKFPKPECATCSRPAGNTLLPVP